MVIYKNFKKFTNSEECDEIVEKIKGQISIDISVSLTKGVEINQT